MRRIKPMGFLIPCLVMTMISIGTSTMLITSPAINPFDDSTIPYSYANIGSIPYGKTLTFDLVEDPTLNLCQSANQSISHFTTPTYLLIDSSFGTCSYTTQAINAQQMGAKGVVFVSDMVNYYNKIVQVDDGNGRKVHITVLFVNTQTYRKLQSISNIHIKVQFETHQSPKVNLTYFLSASGRTNYIFLRQFKPYFMQLKDFINFQPLYLTIKCQHCQVKECLISKDYCTFQMDQYLDNLGEFILREQLRQWNIWKVNGAEAYLEYMDRFDQYCSGNWVESGNCGDQIMASIGINKDKIQGAPSEIMDEWRVQMTSAGFLSTPEITINEQLYAGSYNSSEIFAAICESLSNPPQTCTGASVPQPSNTKIFWIIAAIISSCLISMLIGYFVYKKCVKQQLTKDIYTKVNELVAKYATEVSEHDKKRKDRMKMRLNDEL